MALRNLLVGVDFLVVDPEDEYRALCAAVGGQYVRLRQPLGQHLNPFDLPPAGPTTDARGATRWPSRWRRCSALLEVMLAEPGRPLGAARAGGARPGALRDLRRGRDHRRPGDPRPARRRCCATCTPTLAASRRRRSRPSLATAPGALRRRLAAPASSPGRPTSRSTGASSSSTSRRSSRSCGRWAST